MKKNNQYSINEVVVKSNRLIETGYKLGKREQYFVLNLISRLDSMKQSDFHHYEMSFSDIKSILNYGGVKRIANRDTVFEIMNNLNRTPIYWEKEDEYGELEERGQMTWISSLKYNAKTDKFTFSFDVNLKPFLLQLEDFFTKYALTNISNFNKSHSIRMYEILKVYEHQRKVILSVDKLKFYLGVEGKYEKFYEMKRWILDPTQKELEAFTDIRFEYKVEKKERKKVCSLEFTIYQNVPKSQRLSIDAEVKPTASSLYDVVKEWGITKKTFENYQKKYSEEHIQERVQYVQQQIVLKKGKRKEIKNLGGYLNSLMEKENFSDANQQAKIKQVAEKKRAKELLQIQEKLEQELKQTRQRLHEEEVALIQQLFNSDGKKRSEILENVKKEKPQYFDFSLTIDENYEQTVLFRTAVQSYVKKNYSTLFAETQKVYFAKIEKLKKRIYTLR